MKTALVVIDGQNDFVDPRGTLYVSNSRTEVGKLASMVNSFPELFDSIYFTVDEHYVHDIGHPTYWRNRDYNHPIPFTEISKEDVQYERWIPIQVNGEPFKPDYAIRYLTHLENNGKMHVIWPEHCIRTTWGQKIHPKLIQMQEFWMLSHGKPLKKPIIVKGQNPATEHFSAFQAELPNSDPRTQFNDEFLAILKGYERIVWCGWAGSHCLPATIKDYMEAYIGAGANQENVILRDISSPVPGFEDDKKEYMNEFKARGFYYEHATVFVNRVLGI